MEIVGPASFNALRTADWTYVEYFNGERELYDLQADPQQLQNVVTAAEPLLLDQLSRRLAELANCAAANCREIEDLDRKSTRLNSITNAHLVCRLLLEKKKIKKSHNT